jgi:hypothetical protein
MKLIVSLFCILFFSFGMSKSYSGDNEATTVSVKFQNKAHAEHFMTWMSEQGEQDMYVWMEEAEPELAKMPSYDSKRYIIDYSK